MANILAPVGGVPGLTLAPAMAVQPRGDVPDYPVPSNNPGNLTPPAGFFKGYNSALENSPTIPVPLGASWDHNARAAVTGLYPVAGTVVDHVGVITAPLACPAPVKDGTNPLKYTWTATGGMQPRTLVIAGLRSDALSDSGVATVTFPGPGTYRWSVSDVVGTPISGVLVVSGAAEDPPVTHWDPPYPWEGFSTHQTINDWVEEHDLQVPSDWFQGTLSTKKAYLAETYGDG